MKIVTGKYAEFFRFCVVGVVCTGIDMCIYYFVRIIFSYVVALVCGYVLSLVINYFLTIFWTFNSKPNTKNAIGVVVAHLFNLFVMRMGLMHVLVDCLNINDKVAYLPTLVISVVTNFIIVKFVISRCK